MKTVIITGSSSGIGMASAKRFATQGWRVILLARRKNLLEEIKKSRSDSEKHLAVSGDYSRPETTIRLTALLHDNGIEKIDALVNCAGISVAEPAITTPMEQWRVPLDMMLDGAVLTTRAVVPFMKNGGRIVHVTSVHAFRAEQGASAYATAKAAIGQYCRSIALELADQGILVNAVAPGFVETPMSSVSGTSELETEWFKNDYVKGRHLPLRRAGRPEEIAGVIWFLCGPDAAYITGQTLVVDGGLTITF